MNEFIKNKANAFKMEPREDSWGEIEKRLSKKRKKRLAWLIIPAVFLIGLAVGFLLPKGVENKESNILENQVSKEVLASSENEQSRNTTAFKEGKVTDFELAKESTPELINNFTTPQSIVKMKNTNSGNIKKGVPVYGKEGLVNVNNLDLSMVKTKNVSGELDIIKKVNNRDKETSKVDENKSQDVEVDKEKEVEIVKVEDKELDIDVVAKSEDKLEATKKNRKDDVPNEKGKFNLVVMPTFGLSNYFIVKDKEKVQEAMDYNAYNAEIRMKDSKDLAYGLQIGVNKELKRGWQLSSGLFYQKSSWKSGVGDTFSTASITSNFPNRNSQAKYYHSEGSKTYQNNVQTFGLQVGIGKTILKFNRFDLTPNINFGLGYVSKSTILNYSYYVNLYEETHENSENTQRVLGSVQLGLPLNYSVSNRFKIGVSPMFRTNLNSILKSDLETKKPYSFGAGLVLQFNL